MDFSGYFSIDWVSLQLISRNYVDVGLWSVSSSQGWRWMGWNQIFILCQGTLMSCFYNLLYGRTYEQCYSILECLFSNDECPEILSFFSSLYLYLYLYLSNVHFSLQMEIPRAFVCAESKIFDVSEWATCQVSVWLDLTDFTVAILMYDLQLWIFTWNASLFHLKEYEFTSLTDFTVVDYPGNGV